ncbi:phage tail protein [Magnetococcus sp. PR-3]|uniref:phage tail protein n=1 Tax=Magnetococcus sp. PR-3 TaxID=3120355 RepID=UPI002FCE0B6D
MNGSIIIVENPFQPHLNRQQFPILKPITIQDWLLQSQPPEFTLPTICIKNGEPLLRGEWQTELIQSDDLVVFVPLPQGGGGGGSNPLRVVLMIAVMVAAYYFGPVIAGKIGWATKVGEAAITATLAVVGSTLVNVLVPPPMPQMSSFGSSGIQAPSPTYALGVQGNQARLGQPIPVIYGRHLIYPDIAASPYTEYLDNQQYLHQLHCIGQGHYQLESLRIEDTPISSFEEIEYEVIPPGSGVTLFDPDVVTAPEVAGQELIATNLLEEGDDGWIGPFAANPPGTEASAIGIDLAMQSGLYYANSGGGLDERTVEWEAQARQVDDEGTPVGGWMTLDLITVTEATNTPLRLSYKHSVDAGRYEVRLRRTNEKDTDPRAGHELRWSALRAYLDSQPDFGDVTMLAMRMRATDNLSQRSSRMVNCVVTRKLAAWNPTSGWSDLQPSRSIAWAITDALKAEYGAKLTDDRIDLTGLHTLDQIWQSRGDHFDAVFDQKLTVWEAITRIARCGRAVPILQGGTARIIRDQPQTLPVALFSSRNMVKNSLSIQYLMPSEETADAVTVEFFNAETWKPDEVTVSLDDSQSSNPAKVALFGCTDQAHAQREGGYMSAANRYRRRIITFQTEMEGLIPTYGDLIAITHDVPEWGQSAEVVSVDGNRLTLTEPLEWAEGEDHVVAIRNQDGSVSGPWSVQHGMKFNQVIVSDLDFSLAVGAEAERPHITFGTTTQWSLLARVLSIRPRGERVEIMAVGEHESVHLKG